MRAIDVSRRREHIMDALSGIVVAKVVLVDDAERPMWAPCVFRQNGGPMAFVLKLVRVFLVFAHPETLKLGAETLFGLHLPLGFNHVDVGVDNALIVGGHWGDFRIEVEVVVIVFGLPLFVQFSADGGIEIPNKKDIAKTPAVPFKAVQCSIFGVGAKRVVSRLFAAEKLAVSFVPYLPPSRLPWAGCRTLPRLHSSPRDDGGVR